LFEEPGIFSEADDQASKLHPTNAIQSLFWSPIDEIRQHPIQSYDLSALSPHPKFCDYQNNAGSGTSYGINPATSNQSTNAPTHGYHQSDLRPEISTLLYNYDNLPNEYQYQFDKTDSVPSQLRSSINVFDVVDPDQ